MQKRPSHRASLTAGIVAAIVFVGAVASNLIASDLQPVLLKHYRPSVWLTGAIALVVAVVTAIVEVRRRTHLSNSNEPVTQLMRTRNGVQRLVATSTAAR